MRLPTTMTTTKFKAIKVTEAPGSLNIIYYFNADQEKENARTELQKLQYFCAKVKSKLLYFITITYSFQIHWSKFDKRNSSRCPGPQDRSCWATLSTRTRLLLAACCLLKVTTTKTARTGTKLTTTCKHKLSLMFPSRFVVINTSPDWCLSNAFL